jgi:hypothetical protein
MRSRSRLSYVTAALVFTWAATLGANSVEAGEQIEPNAGAWKTWVISSGASYRAPAPPRPNETRAELRLLADLIAQNTAETNAQIAYWDAWSPCVSLD